MNESTRPSTQSSPRLLGLLQVGQIVAGKYRVERELGRGGMGVVCAARDTVLGRPVALKALLPELASSQTAAQRFTREARAATRITSEHVVKLLEIDALPDGAPVLVMEYLEGRDLRSVLRDDGPLTPRLAVDYVLQALQAVAEGHLHGIVHRDLKPSNLFFTERADGSPLIKVLDFGIAKTLEPDLADNFALTGSQDSRLGSPTYMPPEQFRNPGDVDSRADIWALGVTLHELVTGSPPFRGQTFADLVSSISRDPAAALESPRRGMLVPVGLTLVVAKCLEKNRDLRYRDAAELATALAPFGSDDARLSLLRITGLTRVRTQPASPDSGRRDSLGTCETTLPAPYGPEFEQSRTQTSPGARLPSKRPRRLAGLAGSLLAAAALLVLLFWRPTRDASRSTSSAPPVSLDSALGAAKPAPAPPPESAPPTAIATAPTPVPPASAAPQAKPLDAHARKADKSAATSKPIADGMLEPAPMASAASAERAASADGAGPSPLIESLIEKRH